MFVGHFHRCVKRDGALGDPLTMLVRHFYRYVERHKVVGDALTMLIRKLGRPADYLRNFLSVLIWNLCKLVMLISHLLATLLC
jgi:hypothetical protein